MQTYLNIDEFCKLVHLEREVIEGMINRGVLNTKEEGGEILIEASQGTMCLASWPCRLRRSARTVLAS